MQVVEPKTGEELGALIRRFRKERYLTIDALADRAGLSANYIGTIERGTRDPGLLSLCAIANALDMSMRELLGGYAERFSAETLQFVTLYDKAPPKIRSAIDVLLRRS